MISTDPTPTKTRSVPSWWRFLAIFLALAMLLGWAASASMIEQLKAQIGHMQTRLQDTPQIRYVSVLLDDKGLPAMLVTMDPQQGHMQIQRLNAVKEGREDTMQLWAVTESQAPRSLGVITSKYQTMELPAPEKALAGADSLAISVEEKGGVSETQGPRLPYLFQGSLVQKSI